MHQPSLVRINAVLLVEWLMCFLSILGLNMRGSMAQGLLTQEKRVRAGVEINFTRIVTLLVQLCMRNSGVCCSGARFQVKFAHFEAQESFPSLSNPCQVRP